MSQQTPHAAGRSAREGLPASSEREQAPAPRWFAPRRPASPTPVYHVADQPSAVHATYPVGGGTRPAVGADSSVAARWRAEETLRSMRSEHSSNARARLFRKRISWLSLLAGALLVGILVHACLAGRWQFVLPTLILLSLVIGSIVVLRQA